MMAHPASSADEGIEPIEKCQIVAIALEACPHQPGQHRKDAHRVAIPYNRGASTVSQNTPTGVLPLYHRTHAPSPLFLGNSLLLSA